MILNKRTALRYVHQRGLKILPIAALIIVVVALSGSAKWTEVLKTNKYKGKSVQAVRSVPQLPQCNDPGPGKALDSNEHSASLEPGLIQHIRENVLKHTGIMGPAQSLVPGPFAEHEPDDPFQGVQAMKKILIPKLFPNLQGPGKFFESGALNTYNFSSTYYLEKKYGWTGLLVEMSPLNNPYEQALKHNRRNVLTAAACLTPSERPCKGRYRLDTIRDPDISKYKGASNEIWDGHLDDSEKSAGKSNSQETKQFSEWAEEKAVPAGNGFYVWEKDVDCYPLISLLTAANLTSIDFFSLDIEGKEDTILYTLPWDLVDIKVIRMDLSQYRFNELPIIRFLESKGYRFLRELIHYGDDFWVFTKI